MKRSTLHAIFRKGGERLPMTSPGRARAVRRALYIERKRVANLAALAKKQGMWDVEAVEVADLAAKLQFRVEGAVLIVEPVPTESPVDVELERVRAASE